MAEKRCLIYETLGKVSNLQVTESAGSEMRLSGVFGVCGVKNQNNRVYDKENYKQMVESLQKTIKECGCPGELEHPNSMNINLENVSHKIEDIQMNEDGTVTGTILLLNTPKGQIAKAIVEGGLPLYISSRGSGTITNEGRVTLSTIKTYDLVGTPGFSQAKLTLKPNQTLECLNEGLDEDSQNQVWAIVENDEKSSEDLKDESKEDKSEDENKKEPKEESKEEPKKEDNKNNDNDKVNMKDLKEAIDALTEKVNSLEAQLHVAQESLEDIKPINYDAIENWVSNEFAPEFKESLMNNVNTLVEESAYSVDYDSIKDSIKEEVNNSINILAEGVQNWVVEEFAPEVQNWVCEEFAPEVQNWIVEEYSTEIQNWITEEYSPAIEGWITEEYTPNLENKINESTNANRLSEIDNLLEAISSDENSDVQKIVKEQKIDEKYKGVYVVENMPLEYAPSWQLLDESRKDEIIRTSKMYDFTKEGVLESFWANVDFNKQTVVKEQKNEDIVSDYHNNIVAGMMRLRKTL